MPAINSVLGVLVMLVGFVLVLAAIDFYLVDIWTMELEEEITTRKLPHAIRAALRLQKAGAFSEVWHMA